MYFVFYFDTLLHGKPRVNDSRLLPKVSLLIYIWKGKNKPTFFYLAQ